MVFDLLLSSLIHPIFASMTSNITNALPTINIPATLTPVFSNSLPSTGSPLADTATVTGIIAAIGSAVTAVKNHLDDKKQDQRTEALANAQLSTIDSLKLTDMGVKENVNALNQLVQTLAQHPELKTLLTTAQTNGTLSSASVLDLIKGEAQGWDQSIKDYYNNMNRQEGDYSSDKVINKTADVLKVTQPSSTSS